ncbi:MAG: exodeoxyribonuclease VII large subunit [Bacteroidetes bacterium]|nr:exodeoxyribonuclease VII large subunit [Bacteroidota bacterium]
MDLFNDIPTVSELTKQIKQTLETNFEKISVQGEISNFKAHVSGHWYFSLKDKNAAISCTMWKGFNNYVFFTPEDGMKITLNGKLTVYPPRGSYQIDVRSMKPAGVGELQAAFERLKKKLSDEGLFNVESKKPIPAFPKKIGVVTAIGGAAFQDMISVAERRYPLVELVIAPSKVQGSGAAESIAISIKKLNKKNDIDVIIVGRGGGSIEDLWAFNEEIVARAIFNSKIPIIAGIGHEIDFTIADFVADLRAPTPTAAMELATPNQNEIASFIEDFVESSEQRVKEKISYSHIKIGRVINSYGFKLPENFVKQNYQKVDNLVYKLFNNIDKKMAYTKNNLYLLIKSIESFDLKKTLKRGFALVKQDSKFITRAKNFNSKKPAILKFYDKEIKLD